MDGIYDLTAILKGDDLKPVSDLEMIRTLSNHKSLLQIVVFVTNRRKINKRRTRFSYDSILCLFHSEQIEGSFFSNLVYPILFELSLAIFQAKSP